MRPAYLEMKALWGCTSMMRHGCISENAKGLDKIVALPESRCSMKTLLKGEATDGILPY
jgi:hypothetical protein